MERTSVIEAPQSVLDNPIDGEWRKAVDPEIALCDAYVAAFSDMVGMPYQDWLLNGPRPAPAMASHCRWMADCLSEAAEQQIDTSSFRALVVGPILSSGSHLGNRVELEAAMQSGALDGLHDNGVRIVTEGICISAEDLDDPLYLHAKSLLETADNADSLALLDSLITLPQTMAERRKTAGHEHPYAELLTLFVDRYGCDKRDALAMIARYKEMYSSMVGEVEKAEAQPSIFDDEDSVRRLQSDREWLDTTSQDEYLCLAGKGLAFREALYGLDGMRAAIKQFHLPVLGAMEVEAVGRMVRLAQKDPVELQRLQEASVSGRLTLMLFNDPLTDHNGAFCDAGSYFLQGFPDAYTMYIGNRDMDSADSAADLLSNEYGITSLHRTVLGLHGNPGKMLVEAADYPCGKGAARVALPLREGADTVPCPSLVNPRRYLGRLVDALLEEDGEIVLHSCYAAKRPSVGPERRTNIEETAQIFGRQVLGGEAAGHITAMYPAGVVQIHYDNLRYGRRMVSSVYRADPTDTMAAPITRPISPRVI